MIGKKPSQTEQIKKKQALWIWNGPRTFCLTFVSQWMTKPQWNKNQKNRRWEWLIPRCWTLTSKYRVLWRTLMGQDRFEHHVPIVRNSLCVLTALQCSKHWSYCKGENLWSTGFQLKPDGRLSTTFKSTGAFDPLRDWFKLARMN